MNKKTTVHNSKQKKKTKTYKVSASLAVGLLVGSVGMVGCDKKPTAQKPVEKPISINPGPVIAKPKIKETDVPKINVAPIPIKKVNVAKQPVPKKPVSDTKAGVKKDPKEVKKIETKPTSMIPVERRVNPGPVMKPKILKVNNK